MPSPARLERAYLHYAIKFVLDCEIVLGDRNAEPADANLKTVLDSCARPAKSTEYAAIRRHVNDYRRDPAAIGA